MTVSAQQGQRKTFWDTVGIKQDISPLITMLSPYDTPLLHVLRSPQKQVTGTKHEWIEDELVPHVDTLHVAITDAAATTCTVHNGSYFLPDDLIKIDDEVMLVTAVNTSTNVLTITRGFGSTSGATHLIDATVDRIGNAKAEGADAGESRSTVKTTDYNYTQIWDETIKVSGTREAIEEYGVESAYAYELAKKLKERAIAVEKAIIHGVRTSDSTGERRTMGGLLEFLTSNVVDASSAAITKGTLNDMLADIWRKGGMPRTLVMNIDQKMNISGVNDNFLRVDQSERGLGGFVEYFVNDLGRFDIILDRNVPRNMILALDLEKVGFGPLKGRDWSHTLMGRKGDYVHGQMLMEGTLEVRGVAAHGIIKNLAL